MQLIAQTKRKLNLPDHHCDYQSLYEQNKKNTAIFIKLVENELAKILAQHKKEKAWLERENYLLREQIKKQQNKKERQTLSKYEPNRKGQNDKSINKNCLEENTRNFLNCGISQITLNDSKSILTEQKTSLFNQPIKKIKEPPNKKTDTSTLNITKTYQLLSESQQNFTSSMLLPDETQDLTDLREAMGKKRTEKKNKDLCKLNDKQSVTDVLKIIRQKAMTPKVSTLNRQDPQYLQRNIISPEMFSNSKRKN